MDSTKTACVRSLASARDDTAFFAQEAGVAGSSGAGAVASVVVGAGPAVAVAADFLFFLIKLRTVSDGCAPRAIQYSARSNFNVLL